MRKYIDWTKKNIKKVTIALLIILLLVICIVGIVKKVTSDGMNNKGIFRVSYRTYTNKWNSFKRNGKTSGNKKDKISDIEIKIKNTKKGNLFYSVYTDSWSDQFNNYSKIGKDIKGIRVGLFGSLNNKYSVCYRTYNKKDKWLNWICDYGISGNIDETVTAVEVKIIPKKSIKFDYLKDFNKLNPLSSIGFDKE